MEERIGQHQPDVIVVYESSSWNGKDRVIFATDEDLKSPSKSMISFSESSEDDVEGAILPNGDINWECPCLGDLPYGPCGEKFREMLSCYHYSTAEPKGSDCDEKIADYFICFNNNSKLYGIDENSSQSRDSIESQAKDPIENQSKDLIDSLSEDTSSSQSEDAFNKKSTEKKS